MKNFEINGKKYVTKDFDFNLVCDLADRGVDISKSLGNPLALVRAYVSICSGLPMETAGKEIQEHIINGGNINDIMGIISNEIDKSDFFRYLNQNQEQKTPKDAN